jgi:hypothetical protein
LRRPRARDLRAGTTLDYVKQAEDIGGTLRVPFGPLSATLVEGVERAVTKHRVGTGIGSKVQSKSIDEVSEQPSLRTLLEARAELVHANCADLPVFPDDSVRNDALRDELSPRILVGVGPSSTAEGPASGESGAGQSGGVEDALAVALERASAAGAWDVVSLLATELRERRLAGSGVVDLGAERARRGRS